MKDLSIHYLHLVKTELKKVSLSQPCGFAIVLGSWPTVDEKQNITGFGPAWALTITIPSAHIGEDIGLLRPVHGVAPKDAEVEKAVSELYMMCRKAYDDQVREDMKSIDLKSIGAKK